MTDKDTRADMAANILEQLDGADYQEIAAIIVGALDAHDTEHPEQVPWLEKVDNWAPEMASDGAPFLAYRPTYRVRADG